MSQRGSMRRYYHLSPFFFSFAEGHCLLLIWCSQNRSYFKLACCLAESFAVAHPITGSWQPPRGSEGCSSIGIGRDGCWLNIQWDEQHPFNGWFYCCDIDSTRDGLLRNSLGGFLQGTVRDWSTSKWISHLRGLWFSTFSLICIAASLSRHSFFRGRKLAKSLVTANGHLNIQSPTRR